MQLRTKKRRVTLRAVRSYLEQRANDLIDLSKRGDPWFYSCACTLLEVCASLRNGAPVGKANYKKFCVDFLFPVRPAYGAATYPTTGLKLEDQFYHILRCGVVHAFSMTPDSHPSSASFNPTARSIMLAHEQPLLTHLMRVKIFRGPEAYVLIAQDFAKDIADMIIALFKRANCHDPDGATIRSNILKQFSKHPPLGWLTYEQV